MFPVSLEFYNGNVVTVNPPCYGFLKQGNWSNISSFDHDEDDDDYYDDGSPEYEYCEGWNIIYDVSGTSSREFNDRSISLYGYFDGESNELGSVFDLSNIRYIWNSGTHYPLIGEDEGEPVCGQYDHIEGECAPLENIVQPLDNVQKWVKENRWEEPITVKTVMDMFEEYVDYGKDSCFVWQENGCFGVTAATNADRCLFYLMINRSLHQKEEQENVFMMLDCLFKDKMTPVQALMVSRIIVENVNFLGEKTVEWVGNDYDSCILPLTLINEGHGSLFSEPVSVEWRQKSYNKSSGHLRDECYCNITRQFEDLRVNNSMFIPLLHPELSSSENPCIYGKSFLLAFVEEICLDVESRVKMTTRRAPHLDLYKMYSTLMNVKVDLPTSGYNVKPSCEWVDIVKNILLRSE